MRSVPMNPAGQAVEWETPEQAQMAAAAVGAAMGAALGGVVWYVASEVHPVGKFLGAALPVVGGVFGYRSWKALMAPQRVLAR